jgi:hypothetical protein
MDWSSNNQEFIVYLSPESIRAMIEYGYTLVIHTPRRPSDEPYPTHL